MPMLGVALVVSGLAFLIGALSAARWGSSHESLFWLYGLAAGFTFTGASTSLLGGKLSAVTDRSAKVRFGLGALVVAGCVFASSRVGVPKTLPGIALGWPLLFHIERGAALIGAIGLATLVLWRGADGEWPISFGNLFQYAPKEAVQVAADAIEEQDDRIAIIEGRLGLKRP
jgi:hypothetical protein